MTWELYATYGALMAAGAGINWLRRRYGPKSDRLKPQDFGDNLGQPFTQPGEVWPVFTGTVKIDGGQLLWAGAKNAVPFNAQGVAPDQWEEEYASLSWEETLDHEGSQDIVGFSYRAVFRIGFGIPLGGGDGAYLRRLWIDDRLVWCGRQREGEIAIGNRNIIIPGLQSSWDADDDEVITPKPHGVATGDGPAFLRLAGDGGALFPSGLSGGTSYWMIRVSATRLAFAASREDAIAGVKVPFLVFGDPALTGHLILLITHRPHLDFEPADVDTGTSEITIPNHGLLTGHGPVRLRNPNGLPGGLDPRYRHWIIKIDDDTIRLAPSYEAAFKPAFVLLPTSGLGTHRMYTQPDGASTFFGGVGRGGGLRGIIEIRGGSSTADQSTLLEAAYEAEPTYASENIPRNKRLAELVFGGYPTDEGMGFDLGESPQMFRVAAEWESIPHFGAEGDVGPFDTYQIGEHDANIGPVLWQLLTNRFSGLGRPTADYDQDTFEAAAETLLDEENGCSMVWGSTNGLRDALEDLLDQGDLHLRQNHSTGQVELVAIRPDYVVGDLPRFNQDNVEDVKVGRSTWEECFNQVDVHYPNRAAEHRDRPATAMDQALVNGPHEGEVRAVDIHYPGVRTAALASSLASRELHGCSVPRKTLQIFTNRDGANGILSGDVVVVDWPDEGIEDLPCRIVNIHYGELDDPTVMVEAVEDEFAQQQGTGFPAVEVPATIITTDPQAVTVHGAMEAWRWLLVKAGATDPDIARVYYLAEDPGPSANGFRPWASKDAGVHYALDKNPMPFCARAVLELDLLRTEEPYDTSSYIQIEDLSIPNGGPESTVMLATLSQSQISSEGRNLAVVGDPSDPAGHEIVAWEELSPFAPGNYQLQDPWRGLFDTAPRHWPAGTPIWFLGQVKLSTLGGLVFAGTESLQLQLPTRGSFAEMDRDDATVVELELNRRAARPLCPSRFRLRQDIGVSSGTLTNDLTDEDAHPSAKFG